LRLGRGCIPRKPPLLGRQAGTAPSAGLSHDVPLIIIPPAKFWRHGADLCPAHAAPSAARVPPCYLSSRAHKSRAHFSLMMSDVSFPTIQSPVGGRVTEIERDAPSAKGHPWELRNSLLAGVPKAVLATWPFDGFPTAKARVRFSIREAATCSLPY
jgi:hypothetical protein